MRGASTTYSILDQLNPTPIRSAGRCTTHALSVKIQYRKAPSLTYNRNIFLNGLIGILSYETYCPLVNAVRSSSFKYPLKGFAIARLTTFIKLIGQRWPPQLFITRNVVLSKVFERNTFPGSNGQHLIGRLIVSIVEGLRELDGSLLGSARAVRRLCRGE